MGAVRNGERREKMGINRLLTCILVGIILFFAGGNKAVASWQTGACAGYDSNINRSVDHSEGDTYLAGYVSFVRGPSGESRLGWSGAARLEGASFTGNSYLNYAIISVSPGVTYFLHAFWRIDASPFLEAMAVKDSDQSALAFGGRVSMQQKITTDIYTGQYYVYRDSRADADTYSFTEHVVGVFFGINWTEAFFTEADYEFSRGDSFRTVGGVSQTAASSGLSGKEKGLGNSNGPGHSGGGKDPIHSEAFGTDVIREDVDRHAIGMSAGIDWNKSLSSRIGYTFITTQGDLGTSRSHAGFLDIGYRF
jgi:hypothetical protein